MAKATKKTTTPAPAKVEATKEVQPSSDAKVLAGDEQPEKKDLEEIQDNFLPEFQKEVDDINDIAQLEQLREIELRDDHRKGAFEMIDKRIQDIKDANPGTEDDESKFANPNVVADQQQLQVNDEEITEEEQAAIDQANEEAKQEMIAEIKGYRLDLDKLFHFLQAHHRINATPETDIFLAKAWLGKLLAAFGSENPYSGEDKIQGRNEIPATADHDDSNHFKAELNRFNLVDTFKATIQLRKDLDKIIDWIDSVDLNYFDLGYNSRNAAICRTQAYVHAQQAKFHLGVILGAQKV